VTHLLVSTPPDDHGDPTFLMHADDILALPTLKWVGYLSSTGVYGDRDGGWVDESSEVRPTSKRGSRRAKAEDQWMSLFFKNGLPVHIFRLAGIYGPGRSALDSVRAGVARRIDKPGHAFSRVHVDDIVQVLIASMNKPNPGAIYNIADDNAAPSHEVIAHACELLGLAPPPLIPFDEADMVPIARSFYADNKRVRNDRIKNELGVELLYPDYRSGLAACLAWERTHMAPAPAFTRATGGEG
jgi:nucleoside-diphosphate-sugar epimerase